MQFFDLLSRPRPEFFCEGQITVAVARRKLGRAGKFCFDYSEDQKDCLWKDEVEDMPHPPQKWKEIHLNAQVNQTQVHLRQMCGVLANDSNASEECLSIWLNVAAPNKPQVSSFPNIPLNRRAWPERFQAVRLTIVFFCREGLIPTIYIYT